MPFTGVVFGGGRRDAPRRDTIPHATWGRPRLVHHGAPALPGAEADLHLLDGGKRMGLAYKRDPNGYI